MTPQELFDNAALGIRGQDFRQARDNSHMCATLNEQGHRCALGHSLPSITTPTGMCEEWVSLSYTPLGGRLVEAHDTVLWHGKDAWLIAMAHIALDFGLDDSTLWMELVAA